METYKICYYQNEKPRYFVFNARDKHEANKKWNEFKDTEEEYRGKITIYWSGLLDEWEEMVSIRNERWTFKITIHKFHEKMKELYNKAIIRIKGILYKK